MAHPIILLAAAFRLAGPGGGGDCLADALPAIAAARSRADSMALADRYLGDPPGGDQACGRIVAGFLLGMTSTPAEEDWQHRQRAMDLIEAALRSAPDEARLYLALGNVLYSRQSHTDAMRAFARALDRRGAGTPLTLREVALIHYTRGLVYQDAWRDWRSYGELTITSTGQWRCGKDETPVRDNFTSSATDYTWLIPVNQLCPDQFSANMAVSFDSRTDMKRDALRDLEQAFGAALESDSTFLPAAEALLSEWVYLADWERARGVAEIVARRFPTDYRPHLYLGLVRHETGHDSAAATEFATAFRDMPDSIVAVLTDVTELLRPDQLTALTALDSAGQALARVALWNSLDPVYLTTVNERRLEHYARVTAAGLLFGSTALGEPGWKSFAGRIWIRYGRPRHIWELSFPAGRVVFWDYGPGPDVSFRRGTGYRSYRPTDEAEQISNALTRATPQTYDPSALFDTVMTLRSQVVRALGPGGKPQLIAYAAWPDSLSGGAATGLTMLDLMYQPVAQWRGRIADRPGLSAELNGMAAGAYSLTVEVWDQPRSRLYRMRDTVSTLAIEDSAFAVSDVLLAGDIRSSRGDEATSRRDLTIVPLYGSTVAAGKPVSLAWEIYRLKGAPDGRLRYHVALEVLDDGKQPVLARVLRGVGLRGDERLRTRIEYETTRPLAGGRAVEWLEITSNLRPGEYRVILRLTDDGSEREIVRERRLLVK